MEQIRKFYEKCPFPGTYTEKEVQTIAESWPLTNLTVPRQLDVLDAGCGTGLFSHVFEKLDNTVTGVDFSSDSIHIAQEFSNKNGITKTKFISKDLQKINYNKKFDYIFCNGVLHHMKTPHIAYQRMIDSLKPNGIIVIGLYHRLGRMVNFIRRPFIRTSPYFRKMDTRYRKLSINDDRKESWINDQYFCPYERSYFVEEAINIFFREYGITFQKRYPTGSMISKYSFENGGFFIIEGRK